MSPHTNASETARMSKRLGLRTLVSILVFDHGFPPVVLGKAKSLLKRVCRLSWRGIVYDHEDELGICSTVSGE
jgi:hypothetical protein